MKTGNADRILITGANGQLGRELLRNKPGAIGQVQAFSREDLDITRRDQCVSRVNEIHPDLIINTAAYTAVDRAEDEKDKAFAVNAAGAGYVAEAAAKIGARIIHISTDYVFDGGRGRPYAPDDKPNPLNIYGDSKWQGEQQVLEAAPGMATIVRTSWLYSVFGNNFIKTMLGLMNEKDEISVVADQVGTPTWASGLARTIWNYAAADGVHGIFHWRDDGVASWYDFAVAILEEARSIGLINREVAIRPVTTDEYPLAARRPFYSVLAKDRSIGGKNLPNRHWRASLREMLDDYKRTLSDK
jgi:dTDP-4-dehydrorhamnose reductase